MNKALNMQIEEKQKNQLLDRQKIIEDFKCSTGFKFSCSDKHHLGPYACIDCSNKYQKNFISKK